MTESTTPTPTPEPELVPEISLAEPQQLRVLALTAAKGVLIDGTTLFGGGTNKRPTSDLIDVSNYSLGGSPEAETHERQVVVNVTMNGKESRRAARTVARLAKRHGMGLD